MWQTSLTQGSAFAELCWAISQWSSKAESEWSWTVQPASHPQGHPRALHTISVGLDAFQRHRSSPYHLRPEAVRLACIKFHFLCASELSRHPNSYCDLGSWECSLPWEVIQNGLKAWSLEPDRDGFKFCFWHLLKCISSSKLHYLSESQFFICRMGIIMRLISQGYCENQIRKCLQSAQGLTWQYRMLSLIWISDKQQIMVSTSITHLVSVIYLC